MGTFSVSIQIGDLAGQHFVQVEALVDTGSTYTVLPKDMLEELGIDQKGQRSFELGDDHLVEYPIGYARLCLGEDQTIVLVVFGPEGVAPLLGATALEHLSVAVDPIRQILIPVPALLK
ncbi:MAG: hypothetical protein BZY75_06045 [SAR202 cluster bacterium Io17-Chloro-G7]|nr:MAG: hypothetical protein BZY75_06045 [SAR202 cluster bacterium Io17-Chloro-G7]